MDGAGSIRFSPAAIEPPEIVTDSAVAYLRRPAPMCHNWLSANMIVPPEIEMVLQEPMSLQPIDAAFTKPGDAPTCACTQMMPPDIEIVSPVCVYAPI